MTKGVLDDWKSQIFWIFVSIIFELLIHSIISFFWKDDVFYWAKNNIWLLIVVFISLSILFFAFYLKINKDHRDKEITSLSPNITLGKLYTVIYKGNYLLFGANWRYEVHKHNIFNNISLSIADSPYCPRCNTELEQVTEYFFINRYTWCCPKPGCNYRHRSKYIFFKARLKVKKIIRNELEQQGFVLDN